MNPRTVFDAAGRDVRHALRSIQLNPRYAAIIILSLAVCVGANTAVFSIVQSVLLRPLPAPNADEIVLMANRYPNAGVGDLAWSSGGDYYDRMRYVTALRDQAMFNMTSRILETGSSAERLAGMVTTPSLFRLLRTAPQLGRSFEKSEGEIGNEFKVILSHGLWRRLYAGDQNVIGRDVRLSGRPYTIVGVMPAGFLFFDPEVRFWIPLAFTPEQKLGHHSNQWFSVGRLKAGAAVEQAQSQVDTLNAVNLERFPQMREFLINAGFETKVAPLKDYIVRDIKGGLELLWGGAALVLVIGALNTAGLVVARTGTRTKEMGTRLALGAGLRHLARQSIVENLILSIAGGSLGLASAQALIRSLGATGLDKFPRSGEVRIDATAALFALLVSILAGLVVALFSIGHLARLNPGEALHDFSRTSTGGRAVRSTRKALVAAEVGLTFVLLSSAALMTASFRELLRVQPGYEIDGVLTASTSVPGSRYPGADELNTLMTRCLDAIRSIPGVVSAGATNSIPLSGGPYNDGVIIAEGYQIKSGESVVSPLYINVTPGYFAAMGIRLLRGREFDGRDTGNSLPVIVIDKRITEKFWPGGNPVGRRMHQPSGPDFTVDADTQWLTVAGVVESVRMQDLDGTGNDAGAYYFPYAQTRPRNFTFAVKTNSESAAVAPALRAAIAGIDPSLALFDVRTMTERVSGSLASRRAGLTLSLCFAVISLFLASIGLYGLLSYLAAQRRREIGIRVAVGCPPGRIFRLFLREGAVLAGVGLLLGGAAVVVGRGAMEKVLYGVRPLEPAVLGLVALLLSAVAFLAIAGPARKAARVDPIAALNEQ